MAVNYLYASAICTATSFAGLLWWTVALLDGIKSGGAVVEDKVDAGNGRRAEELLLGSGITICLLVNFAVNIFVLVVLGLKTLFFVQLYPAETRKLLERLINYIVYKGTFLPLVVPPNAYQVLMWSGWLVFLCTLKMFQSLARDRLERLNASPSATPLKYFRVFSVLLLVLAADFLWINLCMTIYKSFNSNLYLLLFFEPLSIAFETLQAVLVHGFQLLDIWQRHSVDSSADCVGYEASYKSVAGSISEWKGVLLRNCGFLLDMMTLFMVFGHYLGTWWLRGMAFHLVDAVLFLNLRALVGAIVKRIRGYIKLRKALSSLNGALPDATSEELCAFNDECAICRGPMARAKKLSCSHLFHLSCLRSWLDQGLTEVYACPTCRRPLFGTRDQTSSVVSEDSDDERTAEHANLGLDQQRVPGRALPVGAFPNRQQNQNDILWRGVGLDSNWVSPWPNPGIDGPSASDAIRSVGLTGVQMMMRHLASVGQNYAHGSLENSAWNLWPSHHASGSSIHASSLRHSRDAAGLRLRNNSPSVNTNTPDILGMADRVREVLPHIPDELIIQDLLRTNNINITVNNLLVLQ